jgi:chromosome segregation ATPase
LPVSKPAGENYYACLTRLEDENDAMDASVRAGERSLASLAHAKRQNAGRLDRLRRDHRTAQYERESQVSLRYEAHADLRAVREALLHQHEKQARLADECDAMRDHLRALTSEVQDETRQHYGLLQARVEQLQGVLEETREEEGELAERLEELRHRKQNEAKEHHAVVERARRVREWQREKLHLAREIRRVSRQIAAERRQLSERPEPEIDHGVNYNPTRPR